MERVDHYSEETRERAHKLLDAGMEMLHSFRESALRCAYCDKHRTAVEFDEECPALLRCALTIASGRNNVVEPVKGCGICGNRMTVIRGRHPRNHEREVCPTCCAERLDQINHISARHYGEAASAEITPAPQPVSA